MKVLLTGSSGQLGSEVKKYLVDADAPSHSVLDICDCEDVSDYFERSKPDIVIHMAAIADVRLCEENKDLAWEVNVEGTRNVVNACESFVSRPLILYPSSPCVFRGDTGGYSESSKVDPINHYGKTKATAEKIVLAYDNSLVFRKNFVRREIWKYPKAFVDRFGTYLFADELAYVISQLPQSQLRGIVHIVGRERLSMYELAKITTPNIVPITMKEVDLDLSADMSLASELVNPFSITRSSSRPVDYSKYVLSRKI